MASNMSIKIESTEGAIDGEYREKVGEIEVWDWQWQMSNSATTHFGKGGGQGVLSIGDLSFTKPVDKASPALRRMLCRGTVFKSAVLTVRKASGGAASFDYVEMTFTNGVIANISASGEKDSPQMTERITLNFPVFKYKYTEQDEGGTAGSSVPMGFSIPEKKEV